MPKVTLKTIEDYPEWVEWLKANTQNPVHFDLTIDSALVEDALLTLLERIDTLTDVINKDWNERGLEVPKDTRMPMTEPHFYKIIDMNGSLIEEQKFEIAKLKMKNNQLRNKQNENIQRR